MYQESEEVREGIKGVIKERSEIVPRTTMMVVRDLARKPIHTRAIMYLFERGVVRQNELAKALHVTQGTISWDMLTLSKANLVTKIRRGEAEGFVLDRRATYYSLPEHINKPFIQELKKCYEYQCLQTIEKLFSPYEWVTVESLKQNKKFMALIVWKLGLKFEDVLKIIVTSGIFYTDADEEDEDYEDVTKFKRAFDNFSRRVPKEQTTPPEPPETVKPTPALEAPTEATAEEFVEVETEEPTETGAEEFLES